MHNWLRPNVSYISDASAKSFRPEILTVLSLSRIKHYSKPPKPSCSVSFDLSKTPHVTIIRPIKGLDPGLYDCLASTFLQTYPKSKLTIYFCVPSRSDTSLPVLHQLLKDFSTFDARIYVLDEDPNAKDLGPNPKIRQVSRAFKEAKGDIIWAIDCNVWVAAGVCGRMVDKLCGYVDGQPYKFVHQLPLVVDMPDSSPSPRFQERGVWSTSSSRLEEMFMSSSHAKFYTAINTVGIAPCIVGKSNMYRRSHLNALTRDLGLSYFSNNICEDHLIGDLLWKSAVPQSVLHHAQTTGTTAPNADWKNHGLILGDLAIQPMSHMSLAEHVARRVRWLRVRKFTVLLATLVEPGTESFLCSLHGALAVTTLPWFNMKLGIPQTWSAFSMLWMLSVVCCALIDRTLYLKLHSRDSIDDNNTPGFVLAKAPKPLREWITTWWVRETLAFPIWFWAFFCGTTVVWRGKALWVGWDMRVHEVEVATEAAYQNGVLDKGKGRKD